MNLGTKIVDWLVRTHLMQGTTLGSSRRALALVALSLSAFSTSVFAQPVVTYTVSGSSGNFTLDFIVNNTTPGSQGFDIYLFSVFVGGDISGSPSGYNTSSFDTDHYWVLGSTPYGPYNKMWIDPTYAQLPTGSTLSGFTVNLTSATAPASVPYFAWGYNYVGIYSGPGNLNTGNPNNPFFMGNAVLVPEPATLTLVVGASLLLIGRSRARK